MEKKRITSIDVAKAAGVSPSTVSLVNNGKANGRVSKELQEKVLNAVRQLDYQPSKAARSLRIGSSNTIALIIPDISNTYFAHVLRGAQLRAKARNYEVTLLEMMENPDWLNWMIKNITNGSIEGVILYLADQIKEEQLSVISSKVVLIETIFDNSASVILSLKEATQSAIQFLLDLGHKQIGYFIADYNKETFHIRYRVYEKLMKNNNIIINPLHIARSRFEIDESINAAKELLSTYPRPTAVFCDDDILAAAVYKAAAILGINIPRDLSVIGFNDVEIARILEPELTTIAIPAKDVGSAAMDLMINILDKELPTIKQIPLKLIKRRSTEVPRTNLHKLLR